MPRFFRPSLRTWLTLQAGLVIFLSVFICAGSLFLFSVEEDRENLDSSLLRQAKIIAHILASNPLKSDDKRLIKTLLASEPNHRRAEIRHPTGHITRFASHTGSPALIVPDQPIPTGPVYYSQKIANLPLRILHYPIDGNLIAIAAKPESLRENLQNVFLLYSVLTVVLFLIVLAGGRWLAGRAIAPIIEMANATTQITSLDTPSRLPINQADCELHRLAQLLNNMLDRLQANVALIRRFTADAAHEIKTPLAIIHGHLENTLRHGSLAAQQEDNLLLTLREVERLNRLVEGLLLLSRSDAGHLDLVLQTLDWSALVEELLLDADILAAPFGLTIESQITPGILIRAEPLHLRQVLLNLLDNACKYNRPDGCIQVRLQADISSARLEITNTGPAISEESVPRLFERFQRGDTSRSRHPSEGSGGLGLGLSISREIIRAHGGHIELVASQPDSTTFAVTLFTAVK